MQLVKPLVRREPTGDAEASREWCRPLAMFWWSAAALLLIFATATALIDGEVSPLVEVTQDLPIAILISAFFFWFVKVGQHADPSGWLWGRKHFPTRATPAALAISAALLAWLGHRYAFRSFSVTRDEDLALFQGALIASGQLMAKIPHQWRDFETVIQPTFMMPVPGGGYWLSSYLPINSALQATGIALGLDGVVSPILAGVAILATYAVGRQLWPANPQVALLAAALAASSAQLLVTAMTPFAATAHLALNMVWLWLFLRGGRLRHGGAIVVGALATGLHQLLFHPLFAAPFIFDLWLRRRYALASVYTVAYAAICLFWLSYWKLLLIGAGIAPLGAAAGGSPRDLNTALALIQEFGPNAFVSVARNLLRFALWQNVLVAPLVVIGAVSAWRSGGPLRNLLLGMLLTTCAMLLLMPEQGLGWGYRYLHGYVGAAALIAASTWSRIAGAATATGKRTAPLLLRGVMVLSACFAATRIWQAHHLIAPYADAQQYLQSLDVDVALVSDDAMWMARALTHGVTPQVDRRPLPLSLLSLTPSQTRALCANRKVMVFQASDAARFGILTSRETVERRRAREEGVRSHLRGLGCRI
jgi:hypothetical protein